MEMENIEEKGSLGASFIQIIGMFMYVWKGDEEILRDVNLSVALSTLWVHVQYTNVC